MQATQQLSSAGQSIWLDNITRELLLTGTLERYIRDLSVVGLTSNPTIFDKAFRHGTAYDASFRAGLRPGTSHEDLFFQLALEVATRAGNVRSMRARGRSACCSPAPGRKIPRLRTFYTLGG